MNESASVPESIGRIYHVSMPSSILQTLRVNAAECPKAVSSTAKIIESAFTHTVRMRSLHLKENDRQG